MTPKEILQSSLLDIVFQHRNKSYGAYTLRKFYNGRLTLAVGAGLAAVMAISLFVHYSRGTMPPTMRLADDNWVNITAIDLPEEIPDIPPVQPSAPQAPSVHYANYQIVDDHQAMTDNPTVDEVNANAISTSTVEVPNFAGEVPQVVVEAAHNAPVVEVEETTTAPLIQRQPEFPGGKQAWMNFLSRHLTVPGELGEGEKRTVLVKFLVSEDGSITGFAVMQSGGKAFDNEVIRVLKKMPKWNPAVQNGRNVAVTFTQPVTFQSVEE